MELGLCFFSSTENGTLLCKNNTAKMKFCLFLKKDDAQILG